MSSLPMSDTQLATTQLATTQLATTQLATTQLSTAPALARTDVTPDVAPGRLALSTISKRGIALTVGATAWATSIFLFGTEGTGYGQRVGDLTGLLFQIGVFSLLTVQARTLATGTSRKARAMFKVEYVLLGLASVWSLLHGVLPNGMRDGALMVLDMFWPLSMLGMFVIGVKLLRAGQWRGQLRFWPFVAETWAIVTVPSYGLFGEGVARWIGGTHLLIGYGVLGLLLARKPHLTQR